MQVLQMTGAGMVKWLDEPEPQPKEDEVLVQTAVSVLCGSELHHYRNGMAAGNPGHEAAGIVKRTGSRVTHLKTGQRVGVSAVTGCGQCAHCKLGRFTWCPDKRGHRNMHAQSFVVPASACNPLPDDVSWELGVLLSGDGLGVPHHTSKKIAHTDVRTLAIFGAGPIGIGNLILQTHLGRRVIVVDLSEWRLDLASRLGAAAVVNPAQGNVVTRIRELTAGEGADVCIEAAGRPETALQCFEAVRTGGTVVFNGEQGPLQLSPSNHFIRRDITAVGSWYYHFSECPEMLALYRNGLPVGKMITHRLPFQDAQTAFADFARGVTGKVALHYPG